MHCSFSAQQEWQKIQLYWVPEDDVVMLSHSEVMQEGVAWQAVLTFADQLHVLQVSQMDISQTLDWLQAFTHFKISLKGKIHLLCTSAKRKLVKGKEGSSMAVP